MSKRACRYFEKLEQEHLVETAKTLCTLKGSEQHEYTQILKRYVSTLANDGINKLKAKLIMDRGSILKKCEVQERLPASVELEDKILQILIILCYFDPFGKNLPSKGDCLQICVSIFSIMVDKLTLLLPGIYKDCKVENQQVVREWE
ncbi:hypothetical protein K457DRAFT_23840 [Linnemannia elongata AG-77]|uniref:Uncharacterized protein n=1 Tax=Linnemannia elongata AG-77 TaxID=1314771 RepID=A0A197JHT7_9FUNG|nr:hypothetical protein K457DRAFT_23840 [Linnemannia elongata AG-77]